LAVFQGGFDRESSEKVAGAKPSGNFVITPWDKSLIYRSAKGVITCSSFSGVCEGKIRGEIAKNTV